MAPYGLFLAAAMNLPTNDETKLALVHLTSPGRMMPLRAGSRTAPRPLSATISNSRSRDRLF